MRSRNPSGHVRTKIFQRTFGREAQVMADGGSSHQARMRFDGTTDPAILVAPGHISFSKPAIHRLHDKVVASISAEILFIRASRVPPDTSDARTPGGVLKLGAGLAPLMGIPSPARIQ